VSKPPFRADHVGSLLRPQELTDARQQWREGNLSAGELKEFEDEHVREVISFQEDVGLKSITDGEFRRDYWHLDFITGFDGIELNEETYGHAFSGGGTVGTFEVTGKLGAHSGFMREHFNFLNANTSQTAKFCIPGPGMTHLRSGRAGISAEAYPEKKIIGPISSPLMLQKSMNLANSAAPICKSTTSVLPIFVTRIFGAASPNAAMIQTNY
tara:strand:+ start:3381 stop:4016 length:636 start_codon:yes stop_codon:yes gene_type:complete